jgi:hypothetical protein
LLYAVFDHDGISVHGVDDGLAVAMRSSALSELKQMFRLDLKQAALNGGRATQPPQQARQPEHELSLDRRLRIIVSGHGKFERCIILGIFQRVDHGFCSQPVTEGILP